MYTQFPGSERPLFVTHTNIMIPTVFLKKDKSKMFLSRRTDPNTPNTHLSQGGASVTNRANHNKATNGTSLLAAASMQELTSEVPELYDN